MKSKICKGRSFLMTLLLGAAAALPAPGSGDGERDEARFNVLFIVIDDLNDWVGCLGGHPDAQTPNLDRMAERGVLFTKAYCAAPTCNPSRTAVLTGIRPSTTGIYYNPQPWRQSPALRKAVTLPQYFKAKGYQSMGSGKIFHGLHPDPVSWNDYWPSQTRCKPEDPVPAVRPVNRLKGDRTFDWGPLVDGDPAMGDWQVADWVIRRLEDEHEKPFFLGCGFFRPHLPWYVPEKYFDRHPLDSITLPDVKEDDLDDVPEMGVKIADPEGDHAAVVGSGQWRKAVQGYLASISFVDACVGRVLDALDRSPHRDRTVVVLWSDHGWHLGEKLHWRKFALWEEATRNLLVIAAPGVTRPGTRCHRTVSLIDIYPTLVDLCGLPPRKVLEGVSLKPLLEDPEAPWERPALTTLSEGNHSVRSERWRYIRYADGTEELYDHERDPLEWNNLAGRAEHDAVKKDLARWLPDAGSNTEPDGDKDGDTGGDGGADKDEYWGGDGGGDQDGGSPVEK